MQRVRSNYVDTVTKETKEKKILNCGVQLAPYGHPLNRGVQKYIGIG